MLKRLRIWLSRRREHKNWAYAGTFSTQRGEGRPAYVPPEYRKVINFESKDAR